MEAVATTPQRTVRKAKEHYHGPRLSRYLPHFFVGVLVLEALAVIIGVS